MTRYLMNPDPERLARFMDTLLTTPDETWSGYLGEAFLAIDSPGVVRALRPG